MTETFWIEFAQKLLLAFLPVIASMLTALLYALFRKYWAEFKNNKPDLAWAIERAASMAVKAAEQAGAAEYIDNKKQYALDTAEKWLTAQGLPIDLDLIDAAIEAAVYEEFNKDKQPQPKPAGFLEASK